MTNEDLVRSAWQAIDNSFVITSREPTGAAVLDSTGLVWTAGSVEAAMGQIGQSAELTAVAMALTNSRQVLVKVAIARRGLKPQECDLAAIELLKQHSDHVTVLVASDEGVFTQWDVLRLLPA
jgi:cytidine deaminase